ncbi:Hypothetical predicted protein [Cloeon dipterum]|uniref:BTB domain-containing protein n=1 Tax=Cloeon dipterum TaxID=197152 RepID=A0A8S1DZP3_9INSE|nr:Hypothetical predicted protein [Cloeon dipterum]
MSDSLDKWKIFRKLSDELKRNIRLAVVLRDGAIYVTKDDEVFGFGKNEEGFLATGDKLPRTEHTKIEQLCGQNIQGFQFSTYTFFAISASGSVFAWGSNCYGQLGLGTKQQTLVPTKVGGTLGTKRVVQVACSGMHTLALTSDREVFSFGHNDCGQLGLVQNEDQTRPMKLDFPFSGKVVTAIACLCSSSVALLDSGEVLAWGSNNDDDIGDDVRVLRIPRKVPGLYGIKITRIMSGANHALALSNDGKVYSWGWNKYGELGNGRTDEHCHQPTLISGNVKRVIRDVAAHYDCDLNAAITEADEVYIWGCFINGQKILLPTETTFTSLDEVFAKLPLPAVTYRPLRPKLAEETKNASPEWLRKSFDDAATADVVFLVEGKKIHAHKAILLMRCATFRTLFQGGLKVSRKSSEGEQIIEHHSYVAFYAFLKYLYTDEIDFPPHSAIELLGLAYLFHLPALQEKCGQSVKKDVTVENAAAIFEEATNYEELKDLEEYVFKFCLDHMTGVISSDGFKIAKNT